MAEGEPVGARRSSTGDGRSVSTGGTILVRIQRLHGAVRAAREEAAERPATLPQPATVDSQHETPPRVLVTPAPAKAPPNAPESHPQMPESITPSVSQEGTPAVHNADLCPICSENPIQAQYRGKGCCVRCMEELRGW